MRKLLHRTADDATFVDAEEADYELKDEEYWIEEEPVDVDEYNISPQDWPDFLEQNPDLLDDIEWDKLDGLAWNQILRNKPEYIQYFKPEYKDKIYDSLLTHILSKQPQLIEYFKDCLYKLDREPGSRITLESHWSFLLVDQPQFIEYCDYEKNLAGIDWAYILGKHPQLAEYADWSRLRPEDWADLRKEQPQFMEYCVEYPKEEIDAWEYWEEDPMHRSLTYYTDGSEEKYKLNKGDTMETDNINTEDIYDEGESFEVTNAIDNTIDVGFAISVGDGHMIEEGAKEDGVELTQEDWDTLSDDIAQVESNIVGWLRDFVKGGAGDHGHNSDDELVGVCEVSTDRSSPDYDLVYSVLDSREPLRTSSGSITYVIDEDTLWKNTSDLSFYIDASLDFFVTDEEKEEYFSEEPIDAPAVESYKVTNNKETNMKSYKVTKNAFINVADGTYELEVGDEMRVIIAAKINTDDPGYTVLQQAINQLSLPDNISLDIVCFDMSRTSNNIIIELKIDGKSLSGGESHYLNVEYEVASSNVPGVFSFDTVDAAINFLHTNEGEFAVDINKVQGVVSDIYINAIRSALSLQLEDGFYEIPDDKIVEATVSDLDVPYWIAEEYPDFEKHPELYRAELEMGSVWVATDSGYVVLVKGPGYYTQEEYVEEDELEYFKEQNDLNALELEMVKQQFIITGTGDIVVEIPAIFIRVYIPEDVALREVKRLIDEQGATTNEEVEGVVDTFVEGLTIPEGGEYRDAIYVGLYADLGLVDGEFNTMEAGINIQSENMIMPAEFEKQVFGKSFESEYSHEFLEISPDVRFQLAGYGGEFGEEYPVEGWYRQYDMWVKIPEDVREDIDNIDDETITDLGYKDYDDFYESYINSLRENLIDEVQPFYDKADNIDGLFIEKGDIDLSYEGGDFIYIMKVATAQDWLG